MHVVGVVSGCDQWVWLPQVHAFLLPDAVHDIDDLQSQHILPEICKRGWGQLLLTQSVPTISILEHDPDIL